VFFNKQDDNNLYAEHWEYQCAEDSTVLRRVRLTINRNTLMEMKASGWKMHNNESSGLASQGTYAGGECLPGLIFKNHQQEMP
jgi:hypothetical protein